MALMIVARKAEGEYEEDKHNTSCASKLGVVREDPSNQEGSANPDSEAPTQEPWSKWVEMQWQLEATVKGAQSMPTKHHYRNPISIRERTVKALVPAARDLNRK